MNGDAVFNYSVYKGFSHIEKSVTVPDFYTLKNSTLSSPAKIAKLSVSLSGYIKVVLMTLHFN